MANFKVIGCCFLFLGIILIPILAISLRLNNGINHLKLIIDHDGGADDAIAIFMAILYEKYFNGPKIVALTTNYGNVYEEQVFINTQRILDVAQRRNVPIYRGMNESLINSFVSDYYYGKDGLGDTDYHSTFKPIEAQPGHAVIALLELSKKYKGELVIACIGPLTNLAMAAKIDPNFIGRLNQLYIGAGHLHDADHPEPEFNALVDVEAYYVVAEKALPDIVTVVPFSQTNSSMDITRDWRLNVLGSINTKIVKAINAFENLTIMQEDVWDQLDPAVIGVVLDHEVVTETKYSNNSIILCGNERGINTNIFGLKETSNVKMMFSMDEEKYKRLLIDIFSSNL